MMTGSELQSRCDEIMTEEESVMAEHLCEAHSVGTYANSITSDVPPLTPRIRHHTCAQA